LAGGQGHGETSSHSSAFCKNNKSHTKLGKMGNVCLIVLLNTSILIITIYFLGGRGLFSLISVLRHRLQAKMDAYNLLRFSAGSFGLTYSRSDYYLGRSIIPLRLNCRCTSK
jgi:hypothetical protein